MILATTNDIGLPVRFVRSWKGRELRGVITHIVGDGRIVVDWGVDHTGEVIGVWKELPRDLEWEEIPDLFEIPMKEGSNDR